VRRFASFGYDGNRAIAELVASSEWHTLEQALASLTLFASPITVSALDDKPVFRIVRGHPLRNMDYENRVMNDQDGNHGPIMAFRWATGFGGSSDIQFNHIYQVGKRYKVSERVQYFTNLANLCVTPTFLGRYTDKLGSNLLQYRAWELFRLLSPEGKIPVKPARYDLLNWAPPLDPVSDVESLMREMMSTKPKDALTESVRELGWVFSAFQPDPSIDRDAARAPRAVRTPNHSNPRLAGPYTIERLCIGLLEKNVPHNTILAEVKRQFPRARTTEKCLAWYKNKMKRLPAPS